MTEPFRVGIFPEFEQTPGLIGCNVASLLVNRSTGLGLRYHGLGEPRDDGSQPLVGR
jgi:hypothetical protein